MVRVGLESHLSQSASCATYVLIFGYTSIRSTKEN